MPHVLNKRQAPLIQEEPLVDVPVVVGSDRDLWAVGWMCFFLSTGTLMVEALLPSFLTEELGITHTQLGIFEGLAIALAFGSKIVSGVLSDVFRTRKPIIAIGNSFSFLVKIMFASATTFGFVFAAKCIDRISKGIRASPTEALIADLSTQQTYGKSYGIRQTLYPLGAAMGAVLATGLMLISNNNYRLVFLLAAIPGFLSVVILYYIRQPKIAESTTPQKVPGKISWSLRDTKRLPLPYWLFMLVSTTLMFARFSAAFVMLRAKSAGWEVAFLPLLVVAYEVMNAAVAYPVGKMADRTNRRTMLMIGMGILIFADLILVAATSRWGVLIGFVMVGLHMGVTQGLLSAMIAETTPADLRGTAFAIYCFFTGGAVLIGNMIAGRLSDAFGIHTTFIGGAVFTLIAMAVLFGVIRYTAKQ